MKIKNSVAFVSGANRGIGLAFVEELVKAGAAKVYAAARDPKNLSALSAISPDVVVPIVLDVTKPDIIGAAAEKYGDVNLLINNAGIAGFASFMAAEDTGAARAEMETNYFGTLNMIRAFAPVLSANGGGGIVNLASVAGLANFPALGSYSASKAAVHSLTQGVRAELAAQGTLVMGVYPGPIDTDMAANVQMEKTPPDTVAKNVLDAIEAGEEDVYPDPMAVEFHAGLLADPKAIERNAGEMLPE